MPAYPAQLIYSYPQDRAVTVPPDGHRSFSLPGDVGFQDLLGRGPCPPLSEQSKDASVQNHCTAESPSTSHRRVKHDASYFLSVKCAAVFSCSRRNLFLLLWVSVARL